MAFKIKRKQEYSEDGKEVTITVRARICIIGGPSREAVRDALGIGSEVDFFLEIPAEQKDFELGFVRLRGLKSDVDALKWLNRERRTFCILQGKFGPLKDGSFRSPVYWGSYFCKYDTVSRKGEMSMTFSWKQKHDYGSY